MISTCRVESVERITLASVAFSFSRLAAYFICGAMPARVPAEWRNEAWVASVVLALSVWLVRRIRTVAKARVAP